MFFPNANIYTLIFFMMNIQNNETLLFFRDFLLNIYILSLFVIKYQKLKDYFSLKIFNSTFRVSVLEINIKEMKLYFSLEIFNSRFRVSLCVIKRQKMKLHFSLKHFSYNFRLSFFVMKCVVAKRK